MMLKMNTVVLVVDDTPIQRALMIEILKSYLSDDAHIDSAYDGIEAVERVKARLLNKQHYDFIIMDFCMPRLNGQQATDAIRDLEKEYGVAPSIIMTWSTSKNTPYIGADGILSKPIEPEEIALFIKQSLH